MNWVHGISFVGKWYDILLWFCLNNGFPGFPDPLGPHIATECVNWHTSLTLIPVNLCKAVGCLRRITLVVPAIGKRPPCRAVSPRGQRHFELLPGDTRRNEEQSAVFHVLWERSSIRTIVFNPGTDGDSTCRSRGSLQDAAGSSVGRVFHVKMAGLGHEDLECRLKQGFGS